MQSSPLAVNVGYMHAILEPRTHTKLFCTHQNCQVLELRLRNHSKQKLDFLQLNRCSKFIDRMAQQDKQDRQPKSSGTSASGRSNISARACEIQKTLRKVESNAKLVGQVRISTIFSIKKTAAARFIHRKGIPTIHSDSMVSHSEQLSCSAFFTSPRGTSRGTVMRTACTRTELFPTFSKVSQGQRAASSVVPPRVMTETVTIWLFCSSCHREVMQIRTNTRSLKSEHAT